MWMTRFSKLAKSLLARLQTFVRHLLWKPQPQQPKPETTPQPNNNHVAISLTQRPLITGSNWVAVKNPVVYKFTSTGIGSLVNYRIEVEPYKSSDNTSLTGGIKFS